MADSAMNSTALRHVRLDFDKTSLALGQRQHV